MSAGNRGDLIERLAALPRRVEDAVGDLNDEQLDTPYGKDKWTLRQVVHHLADAHLHGFTRMKQVLTEDHPEMTIYEQTRYALLPDAYRAPIGPSLRILGGVHERWVVMLRGISDSEWGRTGHHFRRGDMSMDDLLELYASHGEGHLGQITGLRNERGW